MPVLRHPPPTRLMVWTAFWVFLLDQATKWFVLYGLDLRNAQEIDLLPPWVNLRMAWNRGVNFGLLADVDMRWILVGLALAISVFVVVWVLREGGGKLVHVAAGLLVGGAMGNVVDRLLHGAVADFLNMSCCGIENPYAFNVADIAVFAGAAGLLLFAGRGNGKVVRRKAPAPGGGKTAEPGKGRAAAPGAGRENGKERRARPAKTG